MIQNNLLTKSLSIALSLVFFLSNGLFAYTLENNFWKQRQKSVSRHSSLGSEHQQLAQLPTTLPSAISASQLPNFNRSFPKPNLKNLKGTEFSGLLQALPAAYGSVRNLTLPNASTTDKIVIHFQDVHQNSEAQTNIAEALKSLVEKSKVDLVALEGAFEPIDLKPFQTFPYPNAISKAADYLLQEHKISGPIHTALTQTESFPPVVGVDNKFHYKANVAAYLDSISLKDKAQDKLESHQETLDDQKKKSFNAELLSFDNLVQSYRAEKINQGVFIESSSQLSSEKLGSNVENFLEAYRLESRLNFSLIESQRSQLIEKLLGQLTQSQTQSLIEISVAYRLGQVKHADFYSYLKNLCEKADVSLTKFSAMDQYVRYVLLTETIEAEALFQEMRTLEKSIYENLAKTQKERDLIQRGDQLYLSQKLVNFSLTPEEWDEYKNVHSPQSLDAFESFYQHAEARDKAITENLLQEMTDIDAKVAVLVTGGFHSKGISRLLTNKKIPTLSFSPKITKLQNESGSSYLSVFTQEKIPLEQLFEGEKLYTAQPPAPQSVRHGLLPALAVSLLSIWGIIGSNATGLFRRLSPTTRQASTKKEGNSAVVSANHANGTEAIEVRYEGTQESGRISSVTQVETWQTRFSGIKQSFSSLQSNPTIQTLFLLIGWSSVAITGAYLLLKSSRVSIDPQTLLLSTSLTLSVIIVVSFYFYLSEPQRLAQLNNRLLSFHLSGAHFSDIHYQWGQGEWAEGDYDILPDEPFTSAMNLGGKPLFPRKGRKSSSYEGKKRPSGNKNRKKGRVFRAYEGDLSQEEILEQEEKRSNKRHKRKNKYPTDIMEPADPFDNEVPNSIEGLRDSLNKIGPRNVDRYEITLRLADMLLASSGHKIKPKNEALTLAEDVLDQISDFRTKEKKGNNISRKVAAAIQAYEKEFLILRALIHESVGGIENIRRAIHSLENAPLSRAPNKIIQSDVEGLTLLARLYVKSNKPENILRAKALLSRSGKGQTLQPRFQKHAPALALWEQIKAIDAEKRSPHTPSIIGQFLLKISQQKTISSDLLGLVFGFVTFGGRVTHESGHFADGVRIGEANNYSLTLENFKFGMPWETKGWGALAGLAANLMAAVVFGLFAVQINSINFQDPGQLIIQGVIIYMAFSNALLFLAEIVSTPIASSRGLTEYADILQFIRGVNIKNLPSPVQLFEKSYNLARGMGFSIQNDPDEVAESYSAHYIKYLQEFQFDEDGKSNGQMVPVVNQTGDTPWPGNALTIKLVNTWDTPETQEKLRDLEEKYGLSPLLKPDVTRIIAFPMDAIFFQKRDSYYAFAKQLKDFWAPLGIPEQNMNFFYGDLTLDRDSPLTSTPDPKDKFSTRQMTDQEFNDLMEDVQNRGLLIDKFLNNTLPHDDLQYAPLRAMSEQIREMREKLESLGGPKIVGGGIGPGYKGEGHWGFTEEDKNFDQAGFIGPAHNFVRKGHAKEDGGMSNRYNKDGKPIDGVITFSYEDFFRRGRNNQDMRTIVLATNNNKAEAVRRLSQEPKDPTAPVSVVQEAGSGSRIDSGVVIADHGSSHLLRFETHPWEFQVMSEEDWTDEMLKKFFIQISKDAENPVPQLEESAFKNPADNSSLRIDRKTRKALGLIYEENKKSLLNKGDWDFLRDRVVRNIITGQQIFDETPEGEFAKSHTSHQYGVRTAEQIVKLLGISEKDTLLLVDPHSDDSPLAVRALIEAYKEAGANVISLVVTPGFTSVHDSFITQTLEIIQTFDLDNLDELTNNTIESLTKRLVGMDDLRSSYKDISQIDQDPWGQLHPDVHANMDSWKQMTSTEQTIRAQILLLQIKQWFNANRIVFDKENLQGYMDFAIGVAPSKPSWSSRDLKIMEDMKKWVRMTENNTAMMSYGLDFHDVRFMDSTWYTNQGRGPAAGGDDIQALKQFILDLIQKENITPTQIISNGEGFPDYGAHANTEITLSIALAELVQEGELKGEDLKYFKYAGVWERLTLGEAGLTLVIDENQVKKERAEFGPHFPSQDFAQVPDSGIVELGTFIDQVHLVNGANSRKELINAVGIRPLNKWGEILEEDGSSVLNYKTVDLTNPDVINEILEKKKERQRVAATKGAATNKEMNGIMPRAAGIEEGIAHLRNSAPEMAAEIGKRESPLADMLAGLKISDLKLFSIMNNFQRDIDMALDRRGSSLAARETFAIPPTGQEIGEFFTINIGGTTARVSHNRLLGKGRYEILNSLEFDYDDQMLSDPISILEKVAENIITLIGKDSESSYEIGVTFSFDMEKTSLVDAEVKRLSKRMDDSTQEEIRKIVGKNPGKVLTAITETRGYPNIKLSAIANDTLSPIFAWLYRFFGSMSIIGYVAYHLQNVFWGTLHAVAGVILGTGHNITLKIKGKFYNLESGNFSGAKHIQTRYDHILEEETKDEIPVGDFTFEKMISGGFLGELLRLHVVDLGKITNDFRWTSSPHMQEPFSMDSLFLTILLGQASETKGLVENYYSKKHSGLVIGEVEAERRRKIEQTIQGVFDVSISNDGKITLNGELNSNEVIQRAYYLEFGVYPTESEIETLREIAQAIVTRSALLVAAELSAVVKKVDPDLKGRHVFPIEGSVFWGIPNYEKIVRDGMTKLLGKEMVDRISFAKEEESTLVGVGIVAAAGKRADREYSIAAQYSFNSYGLSLLATLLFVGGSLLTSSMNPFGINLGWNWDTLLYSAAVFLSFKFIFPFDVFSHEGGHAFVDGQKVFTLDHFNRGGLGGFLMAWLKGSDITDAYVKVKSNPDDKMLISAIAAAGPMANALLFVIGFLVYGLIGSTNPTIEFIGLILMWSNLSLLVINTLGTDYKAILSGRLREDRRLYSGPTSKDSGTGEKSGHKLKTPHTIELIQKTIQVNNETTPDLLEKSASRLKLSLLTAISSDETHQQLGGIDSQIPTDSITEDILEKVISPLMFAFQLGLTKRGEFETFVTFRAQIINGDLVITFETGPLAHPGKFEDGLKTVPQKNWKVSRIERNSDDKSRTIVLTHRIGSATEEQKADQPTLISDLNHYRDSSDKESFRKTVNATILRLNERSLNYSNQTLLDLLSFDDAKLHVAAISELRRRSIEQEENRSVINESIGQVLIDYVWDNPDGRYSPETRRVAMWYLSMYFFSDEFVIFARSKFGIHAHHNDLNREIIGRHLVLVEDDPINHQMTLSVGTPNKRRLWIYVFWNLIPIRKIQKLLGKFISDTADINIAATLTFSPDNPPEANQEIDPKSLSHLKMVAIDAGKYNTGSTKLLRSLFAAWSYYGKVSSGAKVTINSDLEPDPRNSFVRGTGFSNFGEKNENLYFHKKAEAKKPKGLKTTIKDAGGRQPPLPYRFLYFFASLPEEFLHIVGDLGGLLVPINRKATWKAWLQLEPVVVLANHAGKYQRAWHNVPPVSVWIYFSISYFFPTVLGFDYIIQLSHFLSTFFEVRTEFYVWLQMYSFYFQFLYVHVGQLIYDFFTVNPNDDDPTIHSDIYSIFYYLFIYDADKSRSSSNRLNFDQIRNLARNSKVHSSGGSAIAAPRAALRSQKGGRNSSPAAFMNLMTLFYSLLVNFFNKDNNLDLAERLKNHDPKRVEQTTISDDVEKIFSLIRQDLVRGSKSTPYFKRAHDFDMSEAFIKRVMNPEDLLIWWILPEEDTEGNAINLSDYLTPEGLLAYENRHIKEGYTLSLDIFDPTKVREYYTRIDKPQAGLLAEQILNSSGGHGIIVVDSWIQPWNRDPEAAYLGGLDAYRDNYLSEYLQIHFRHAVNRQLDAVARALFLYRIQQIREKQDKDPYSDQELAYIDWLLWNHLERGIPFENLSFSGFESENPELLKRLSQKRSEIGIVSQKGGRSGWWVENLLKNSGKNRNQNSFQQLSSTANNEFQRDNDGRAKPQLRSLTPGGSGPGALIGNPVLNRQTLNTYNGTFSQDPANSQPTSSMDSLARSLTESNADTLGQSTRQTEIAQDKAQEIQREGRLSAVSSDNQQIQSNQQQAQIQNAANNAGTFNPNQNGSAQATATRSNQTNRIPGQTGEASLSNGTDASNASSKSQRTLESILGLGQIGDDGFIADVPGNRETVSQSLNNPSSDTKPQTQPTSGGSDTRSVSRQNQIAQQTAKEQTAPQKPISGTKNDVSQSDNGSSVGDSSSQSIGFGLTGFFSSPFALPASARIAASAATLGVGVFYGWPMALVTFISLKAVFSINPLVNQVDSTQNILISIVPGLSFIFSLSNALLNRTASSQTSSSNDSGELSSESSDAAHSQEPITVSIPAITNNSNGTVINPISVSLTFVPSPGTNPAQASQVVQDLLTLVQDGLFSISAQTGKPVGTIIGDINNQLERQLRRQVQNVMIRAALSRLRKAIANYDWENQDGIWENDNKREEDDLFRKSVLESMIEINSATLTIQEAVIREKFSYTIRGESIMNFLDLLERLLRANGYLEDSPFEDETTSQTQDKTDDTTWEIGDPIEEFEPSQGKNPGDDTPLEELADPETPGPLGELPAETQPEAEGDQTKAPAAEAPQSVENSFGLVVNRVSGLFGLDRFGSSDEPETQASIGLNPPAGMAPISKDIEAVLFPSKEEQRPDNSDSQISAGTLAVAAFAFTGVGAIVAVNYFAFSLIAATVQSFILLEGISLVKNLVTNEAPPPFKTDDDTFAPRRDRNPTITPEQPSTPDEEQELPVRPRIPNDDAENLADAIFLAAEAFRQLDNTNKYELNEILKKILPDLVKFEVGQKEALSQLTSLDGDSIARLIDLINQKALDQFKNGRPTLDQARQIVTWLFRQNWTKHDPNNPIGDGSVFIHAQGGSKERRKREAKAALDLSKTVKKGDYVYVLINNRTKDIEFFTNWRDQLYRYDGTDNIRLVIREQEEELITTDGTHQIVNVVQLGLGLQTLADIWGDETLDQLTVTLPDGTVLGAYEGLEIDEFSTISEILESVNYIWLQEWFDEGRPAEFRQMQNIEELAKALTHA